MPLPLLTIFFSIMIKKRSVVNVTSKKQKYGLVGWFMVFNATFNIISVISWLSVLLVEETRAAKENHRPVV
jgi:hypothetical protein